jgi:glutathione synthase/RimK-type ligase-like ATP-grasp enzyme
MNEKAITIYYEHPDWFRPLFAALEKRGIEFEKVDAADHFYDPAAVKPGGIFFNRMSASAYLRNHGNAIFYTRGILANLEQKGVRVINGYDAFQIEISKALQAVLFDSLGVKYPQTRVVNSVRKIAEAAEDLQFPVIVKPNIGGRGAGIVKFDSMEELRTAIGGGLIDLGIDSTALVQEFAPKKGGFITRVETLNGKFLYAIKIYPNDESFNLCPAEVCLIENQTAGEMCIVDAPRLGLRIEKTEPSAEIIETVERIVQAAKIDVGGVEFLIDERTDEPLFYDINALSNFVADAVNLIGFDPHENLADFLENELEKTAAPDEIGKTTAN